MTRLSKTLLTASFLGLFPAGLLLPIYALYVAGIGGDMLDAGIAYGLFALCSGVFILLVSSTRFFRNNLRLMVVIGFVLVAIGQAGYFFIATPLHLFIAQIIIGIAEGILDPAWDSLFSTDKSQSEATHLWSRWSAGRHIVTGLGAIAGAMIVTAYSFTLLFSIMLVCNLLAVFVSLRLLLEKKE
jgi:sugar phosphate permease